MLAAYVIASMGAKGLAALGLPAASIALRNFRIFCYAVIGGLIIGCWALYDYTSRHIGCNLGDQVKCSELVVWRPDNMTDEQINAWNAHETHHFPDGSIVSLPRRWSLSKTVWYDGEMVQMHRYCIVMNYSQWGENDDDCWDTRILTGKHTGQLFPVKREDANIVSIHYNMFWKYSDYVNFVEQ